MEPADTLQPGTKVADTFTIQRLLGRGGFANTYLASDLNLQRSVAIKEYFPRTFALRTVDMRVAPKSKSHHKDYHWGLQRFSREARILARFQHPNVVRVYQVFDAYDTSYMVMEYVDGADMERWLKGLSVAMDQARLDGLLPGLLGALDMIHKHGVLHRDIKPANIYIRAPSQTPVLLDFGASKFAVGEATGTTAAIVSRGYSPQEAYATEPELQGPWTDIYGLAATLYFSLTRQAPPEATQRVLSDTILPASELGLHGFRRTFLSAIDWGLRVQPSERPRTVAEWVPALLQDKPSPAFKPSTQKPRIFATASAVRSTAPLGERPYSQRVSLPRSAPLPTSHAVSAPAPTSRAAASRAGMQPASTAAVHKRREHVAARAAIIAGLTLGVATLAYTGVRYGEEIADRSSGLFNVLWGGDDSGTTRRGPSFFSPLTRTEPFSAPRTSPSNNSSSASSSSDRSSSSASSRPSRPQRNDGPRPSQPSRSPGPGGIAVPQ